MNAYRCNACGAIAVDAGVVAPVNAERPRSCCPFCESWDWGVASVSGYTTEQLHPTRVSLTVISADVVRSKAVAP